VHTRGGETRQPSLCILDAWDRYAMSSHYRQGEFYENMGSRVIKRCLVRNLLLSIVAFRNYYGLGKLIAGLMQLGRTEKAPGVTPAFFAITDLSFKKFLLRPEGLGTW